MAPVPSDPTSAPAQNNQTTDQRRRSEVVAHHPSDAVGAADGEVKITRVVVVAVDHSANGDKAFTWALDNFIDAKRDLLVLLNVRAATVVPGPFGGAYMDYSDYFADMDQKVRRRDGYGAAKNPTKSSTITPQSPETKTLVLSQYHPCPRSHPPPPLPTFSPHPPNAHPTPQIAVKAIALRGDPRNEIVRKSHEVNADIVILGSRGMGAFRRAMLGSVSDYCIHNLSCPVIIIKDSSTSTATSAQTSTDTLSTKQSQTDTDALRAAGQAAQSKIRIPVPVAGSGLGVGV
ncbi:hypothetical protein HDV00_009614 [Rhizophlyctis rosea]|nr:hypothetical protein HDV00_009614 [Rhizophlyctis rosea]